VQGNERLLVPNVEDHFVEVEFFVDVSETVEVDVVEGDVDVLVVVVEVHGDSDEAVVAFVVLVEEVAGVVFVL
jgi:hypothetical protein